MFSGCVGLPTSFERFRHIWHVDFEFRPDKNRCPQPVSMFAKEHRTGAEIAMRRQDLLRCKYAPFDIGSDTLVVAYSIVAEFTCFNIQHWPMPRNGLCTYFETCAAINGLDIDGLEVKRPGLLEACDLFDIPHMPKEYKQHVRDLILGKPPEDYTEDEWREIEDYNRADVLLTVPLLEALAPTIDVPAALLCSLRRRRGRYGAAWHPHQ
jgi:hypothetical protein